MYVFAASVIPFLMSLSASFLETQELRWLGRGRLCSRVNTLASEVCSYCICWNVSVCVDWKGLLFVCRDMYITISFKLRRFSDTEKVKYRNAHLSHLIRYCNVYVIILWPKHIRKEKYKSDTLSKTRQGNIQETSFFQVDGHEAALNNSQKIKD